ncbi:MAG: GNAT family N-acetyltransferase [Methanomassiliicoccales archaeon]|jgi:GNAT superfamily N-acetyltransferase
MESVSDDISIEKVSEGNFEEFFRLITELARFEHLDPPDGEGKERLRGHAMADRPFYDAYITRMDGRAVGYLIYFYSYSSFKAKPTLYLEDIFVLDDVRGRGIGKMMFLFCVKKAKEAGCGRMEWSALNWNKNAIGFYEGMGAKALSEWTYFRLTEEAIQKLLERS